MDFMFSNEASHLFELGPEDPPAMQTRPVGLYILRGWIRKSLAIVSEGEEGYSLP
jgi:hypothetical protein